MSSVSVHGITLIPPRISILFVTVTKIYMQKNKRSFQGYCKNYSLSEDGAVRPFLSMKITFDYNNKFNLCGNLKLLIALKYDNS